jgi:TPR repeat protein
MSCRICIVLLWTTSALAQVTSFRPLSQPDVSKLLNKAKTGNTESQLRLGMAYQYGLGVSADPKTAEYWLKTAAGFGDPAAQTQLGVLYLQPGFEASRAQAVRWFMRAAGSGFAQAEHNLGLIYTLGWGVQADREQAIHWYRRAAQHGLDGSKANLGALLANSPNPADQKEGFELVSADAKTGRAEAENVLGYCYEYGVGTKVDLAKAVEWYKRAVDKGDVLSMYNLGNLYWKGSGVEQNFVEAFRLYSQACEGGERSACVAVSDSYLRGEGVGRNYATGYQYALMAGADPKRIRTIEQYISDEDRNRAAREAERWKQAHAIQLSASPR